MAETATITIRLTERDLDLKRLLRELRDKEDKLNPYCGRSESEAAKILLREYLPGVHSAICGAPPGASA